MITVVCPICHIEFKRKLSYLNKTKNPCCSRKCSSLLRKQTMAGKNNHQYNLIGKLNSSFKSVERITNYGYISVFKPEHPFCNCNKRVLKHRLVAEEFLLNKDNSIEVNGYKYLKRNLDVHHIDGNKLNNLPDNLLILTRSEHKKLHHKLKRK